MAETTKPTRVPLSVGARAYLREVECGAELAFHERGLAELAVRGRMLLEPRPYGIHQDAHPDRAHVRPGWAIFCALRDRHFKDLEYCRRAAAEAAWWYAAAVTAALGGLLVGDEVTSRRLELATVDHPTHLQQLRRDGMDAPVWAGRYRPALPEPGQLHVGEVAIDAAMDAALSPLIDAYGAAVFLGMDAANPAERYEDVEEEQLADADRRASQIPDLLLTYAKTVHEAVKYADRLAVLVSSRVGDADRADAVTVDACD
jgi:hypothetical protein